MDSYYEERVKVVKNQIILAKRGFQLTLKDLVREMANENLDEVTIPEIVAYVNAIKELEEDLKRAINNLESFNKKREEETNE